MVYIPADIFKDPVKAKMIIQIIEFYDKIVPKEDPLINVLKGKHKLLRTNISSIRNNISETSMESEIKRYIKSRESYSDDLPKAKEKYSKFSSSGNSLGNRFLDVKKNYIKGVGVDGSNNHPKNLSQEERYYNEIQEACKKNGTWSNENEELLKLSIGNTIFWQSSNFGQLPIGTPSEVITAIIILANITKEESSDKYSITGSQIISSPEGKAANGLAYLLEGCKYDIENKSFDGKKKFNNQYFRKIFNSKNNKKISFKLSVGNSETDMTTKNNEILEQTQLTKMIKVLKGTTNTNDKETKFAMIMLIYTLFFTYIAYMNNLYDIMISEIRNDELKAQYQGAKLESTKNFLNLVNYAIKKKFKIKAEFVDLIVAGVGEQESIKKEFKTSSGDVTGHKIKYINFDKAIKAVRLDELKDNVIIGFKNPELYLSLFEEAGSISEDVFTKDNFPIVFTEPASSNDVSNVSIDYKETMKRLTEFILMDDTDKVPMMGETPISVGAPFQNEDILSDTAEALEGWYKSVLESKEIYLNIMDTRVGIFRSGVPDTQIREIKKMIFDELTIIGTTVSGDTEKNIRCVDLIEKLVQKYHYYRKSELKLVDDKSILVDNKFRILGDKPEDYARQYFRAIKRVHYGIEAVVVSEVTKLAYQLFKEKNPTMLICNNFVEEFEKKINQIDSMMNIKIAKTLARKVASIERRFGSSALAGSSSLTLLTLKTIPSPPASYVAEFMALVSGSRPGMPGMPGIPGFPATGSYSLTKRILSDDQRIKIETANYWKNLFSAFENRFILIPVIKMRNIRGTPTYNDEYFYLLDIFRSAFEGKVFRIEFSKNIVGIIRTLYQRGYIMFSNSGMDLNNPAQWKAIDHHVLEKYLKPGEDKFENVAKARDMLFNLLANDAFLKDSMNINLPETSQVSKIIQTFCKTVVLRNKMDKCDILISRDQFARTVQPKLMRFEGPSTIDYVSGMSYVQYSPLGSRIDYIVR